MTDPSTIFSEWPFEGAFNEVHPNLYIGSAVPADVRVRQAGFDVLVLCASDHQFRIQEFAGIEVLHCPFEDNRQAKLDEPTIRLVVMTAKAVSGYLKLGYRVLISCLGGVNRSALVAALAIQHHSPHIDSYDIVQTIRNNRMAIGLSNNDFYAIATGQNQFANSLMSRIVRLSTTRPQFGRLT